MSPEQPGDRVSYIGENARGDGSAAPDPRASPPARQQPKKPLTTTQDLSPAFLMSAVFITLVILIYHFLPATT